MDAVVMCGGRGTRLAADVEKPLLPVGGRRMVDRVIDALVDPADRQGESSGREPHRPAPDVDEVVAAVSPSTPATADHLRDRPVRVLETPGEGYVEDLGTALAAVERPALTVVADLPLLAPDAVERVLRVHRRATDRGSLTVRVPRALKARLGASVDDRVATEDGGTTYLPAGINVVGTAEDDTMYTSHDARLAVNVNRQEDVAVAEALLCD